MANNVFVGPNIVVAAVDTTFADAGYNATNTTIIHKGGSGFGSWKPDYAINSITGFERGYGYLINSKVDREDLNLIPPLPGTEPELSSGEILASLSFLTNNEDTIAGNDAVLVNGAAINDGLVLDGTDDYATIPNVLSETEWGGGIMFRFTPSIDIEAETALLIKLNQAANASIIKLGIDADQKIEAVFGTQVATLEGVTTWATGIERSVIMTWDATFLFIYLDGVKYSKTAIVGDYPSGNANPLTIGAYSDYTVHSAFASGTFKDFIIQDYLVTPAQAIAYHNDEPIVPDMQDKFFPQKGVVKIQRAGAETLCAEPHTFVRLDGTVVKLYTVMYAGNAHGIAMATAPTPFGVHTLHGQVIGPPDYNLGHTGGFEFEGDWYIIGTNAGGGSTGMYLFKSVDEGETWTYEGELFTNMSLLGTTEPFGNFEICVEQVGDTLLPALVDGFYWGTVEAQTGAGPNAWEVYWIKSTDPLTGWVLVEKLDELPFVEGGGCGSSFICYHDELFHIFTGFTGDYDLPDFTKDLPSRIFYANSPTGLNGTWVNKEIAFGLPDRPLGVATDQLTDPSFYIWEDEIYVDACYMVNPPEADYNGCIATWTTGGTLSELLI